MTFLKILASHRFSRYLTLSVFIGDLLLLNSAYCLSLYISFGIYSPFKNEEVESLWLISNALWIFGVLYFQDAYKLRRVDRIRVSLSKATKLIFIHLFVLALFVLLLKMHEISRLRLFHFYTLFFTSLILFRILFLYFLKYIRSLGYNFRNIVFVGLNETGLKMTKLLLQDLSYGYRILGYFDHLPKIALQTEIALLGNLGNLVAYSDKNKIDEIYVCSTNYPDPEIQHLITLCERKMIRLKFLPDFNFQTTTNRLNLQFYDNIPLFMLRNEPMDLIRNRLLKRLFDVVFSSLVIFFIIPWLFPLILLGIKLGSRGPIFFKQLRSGEDNRSFLCYKFRTMRVNRLSDELQATKGDARITKFGAFLRKSNLDEFPQFLNVLFGNMTTVGPRPHMLKHTEEYSGLIDNYLVRHFVKPGITGWAQVNGYRGETENLTDMEKRVEFDIWYIENWSFWLDLKTILKTITNMFKEDKKAY